MYSRDEIRALTDKVLNMAKADAVEVTFDGGERSATRWANSSITVNLVQYDQQLTINLRDGQKQGTASTREFDEESLKVAPSPATTNMSLLVEGTNQSVDDMVKTTKRGLLVTFFWYLRPVDTLTLLNTGMTRDGLFLIENGEIAGPVQNFRWNMSPLVAFANLSAAGKPVPIHTGEAYDGPGTALVPAIRVEDFCMTSVSPAV
jgi:predicted Zn-dependent protease